jgi:hypothetical protein
MKHMTMKTLLAALFLLSGSTAVMATAAQTDSTQVETDHALLRKMVKDDSPEWVKDLTSRFTFYGYMQGGYEWNDKDGTNANSFNFKRAIVWVNARITDRWSFRYMHNFAGGPLEFYMDYRITKSSALNVRVGQFKNALTLENPMSPSALELVDVNSQIVTYLAGCSDPISGLTSGRDLGLKIFGDLFNGHFYYEAAVMNGSGINRLDDNRQKDYLLHLEYRPIEGLRFVASGQLGTGHARGTAAWNPDIQVGDNYSRDRYSFGAEYKFGQYGKTKLMAARPISLRAEWVGGRDGDVGNRGGYLTVCVPVWNGIDIIASGDYIDYNTSVKGWHQTNATIGLQYWILKKCRLQLQYTHAFCGEFRGEDYNRIQAQLQVGF